jgi:hypothetical protein
MSPLRADLPLLREHTCACEVFTRNTAHAHHRVLYVMYIYVYSSACKSCKTLVLITKKLSFNRWVWVCLIKYCDACFEACV